MHIFQDDDMLYRYEELCLRKNKGKKSRNVKKSYYDLKSHSNIKKEMNKFVDVHFNFDENFLPNFSMEEILKYENMILSYFHITRDKIDLIDIHIFFDTFSQKLDDLISREYKPNENFEDVGSNEYLIPSNKVKNAKNNYFMFLYNTIRNYENKILIPEEISDGYCDICFEDKDNMVNLHCNHFCCSNCLIEMSKDKIKTICPFCRQNTLLKSNFIVDTNKFIKPISFNDKSDLMNDVYKYVKTIYKSRYCYFFPYFLRYFAIERGYDSSHISIFNYDKIIKRINETFNYDKIKFEMNEEIKKFPFYPDCYQYVNDDISPEFKNIIF